MRVGSIDSGIAAAYDNELEGLKIASGQDVPSFHIELVDGDGQVMTTDHTSSATISSPDNDVVLIGNV